jgi:hypothetical protein
MIDDPRARLTAELGSLRAEHRQLEDALPPHGLKPSHYRRLEELEELIEEKSRALAALEPGRDQED